MATEHEGILLRDYLKVVSKRRSVAISFGVTSFALVMLVTFALTPQYQGTTQVLIEKVDPPGLTGKYYYNQDDPEFFDTQFQLIKSHAVARRVVEMLDLEENYAAFVGDREGAFAILRPVKDWLSRSKNAVKDAVLRVLRLDNPITSSTSPELSRLDQIAGKITKGIEVQPILNSRIVAISYRSPNPEFSALVANTIAKAYIEQTLDMKMESIRRTLGWMSEKADEERLKLEAAERELQEYMRTNTLVTLEDRLAVVPQQLTQLTTDLVKAESKRKEMEALYAKARQVSGNPAAAETVPAIASSSAFETLQAQILKAEQYIMELSGKYGSKHPSMRKAVRDLDVLKSKKRHEIARMIESIKNEYELARSTEESLRLQLDKTKSEALNLNEKYIQYGVLKREMETNRQLYDALMARVKEQSITGENQQVVNLWIVEKARIPKDPIFPQKPIHAAVGLMVALFGGMGLCFLLEYLDNTIKDPEDAEGALGAPVLGAITLWSEKGRKIEEALLKDPRSIFAESYAALRTALLLSSADAPPKRILISSPAMGEGKTTTSVNLAYALAQAENRVLLIDGDLRKPRLHKIFKLGNKKGLSTYLAGTTGGDILEKGPVSTLTVIPAGPVPPNPSELLASSRMRTLLDTLGQEFDVIISDSPPLLSVADARILSRVFEGTLLVTHARRTTYDAARRSLKLLHDVKAHVLGLVVNGLDMRKSGYYYYEYYDHRPEPIPESRLTPPLGSSKTVR